MIESCPYKDRCGSCQYIGMSYAKQLNRKYEYIKNLFKHLANPLPIIGMKNPNCYRNKVHMAFDVDKKGQIISGLYEVSTHKIVKVDYCMLDDKVADEIILDIKSLMPKYHLTAYSEYKRTGLLRHVLIKRSFVTGETMVVLVLTIDKFRLADEFAKELVKLHPNICSVILNFNNKFTSMILGDKERVIFGKSNICDVLCSMKFNISSKSFYQVNPIQAEVLYSEALKMASLSKDDILLDAYSGTGTIGLIASKNVKHVLSVELNSDAVKDARINAKINNVKNITFVCDDATNYINMLAHDKMHIDVVILDPPRTGSSKQFLNALNKLKPKRIIYISCGPETLKRDLDYLLRQDLYKVDCIQPVDMFPHTEHVETIVMLNPTLIDTHKKNK